MYVRLMIAIVIIVKNIDDLIRSKRLSKELIVVLIRSGPICWAHSESCGCATVEMFLLSAGEEG